jgi:alpha-beta hydrolase superfamily lysophospholipase
VGRSILVIALLLSACTPRLQPLGPDSAVPRLVDDRIIMADGVGLPLRRWLPDGTPKTIILALHGFNDYSNAFDGPAKAWTAEGIATYAYDQRGFGQAPHRGLWPGEDRLIEDLRTAANLVAARHPGTALYLLGESMGGAVVMAATATPDPPRATGLILVAPAVWGRDEQGPLQSGALWLAAHTVPWMRLTGEGLDVKPSDNIAMLRKLARDPLVIKKTRIDALFGLTNLMDRASDAAPTLRDRSLILYGSHEDVIPDSAVLSMLRRLPADEGAERRIAVYPDGYHMLLRDRKADVVLRDVAAWIDGPDVPLPSGSDRLAETLLARDQDDLAVRLPPAGAPSDATAQ